MTYMNLSNMEYVALAAYLLSAFEKPIDTEDIAIKAHEMAPERFCWKKYPDPMAWAIRVTSRVTSTLYSYSATVLPSACSEPSIITLEKPARIAVRHTAGDWP